MTEADFAQEKQAIAQAIQQRNVQQAEQLLSGLEQRTSTPEVTGLLIEVLSSLSPEDVAWVTENLIPEDVYAEIDEQVMMMLYQMLVQKGFQPGRDFSISAGGIVLSPAAHDAILPDIPPDYRDVFSSEIVTIQTESPVQILEQELGIPFVDNLLNRIDQRLPTLRDLEAAMYLYQLCTGVEKRTGIPLMEILISQFGEDPQFAQIFGLIDQGKAAENNDWVYDLVTSTGGDAEIQPDPEDRTKYLLTAEGKRLLDRVYQGN